MNAQGSLNQPTVCISCSVTAEPATAYTHIQEARVWLALENYPPYLEVYFDFEYTPHHLLMVDDNSLGLPPPEDEYDIDVPLVIGRLSNLFRYT